MSWNQPITSGDHGGLVGVGRARPGRVQPDTGVDRGFRVLCIGRGLRRRREAATDSASSTTSPTDRDQTPESCRAAIPKSRASCGLPPQSNEPTRSYLIPGQRLRIPPRTNPDPSHGPPDPRTHGPRDPRTPRPRALPGAGSFSPLGATADVASALQRYSVALPVPGAEHARNRR